MDSTGKPKFDHKNPKDRKELAVRVTKILSEGKIGQNLVQEQGFDRAVELIVESASRPTVVLKFEAVLPHKFAVDQESDKEFGERMAATIRKGLGLHFEGAFRLVGVEEGELPSIEMLGMDK